MYEAFFGLKRRPFDTSPDPSFLFLAPTHSEALAALEYATLSGAGLMTIIGEVGLGKTTVLRAFESKLDQFNAVYISISFPRISFEDLLDLISTKLNLDRTGKNQTQTIQFLRDYLIEMKNRDQKFILIIDEAQSIPIDTLEAIRLLTNIELDHTKLFQIILAGQPEFEAILARRRWRPLEQRIQIKVRLLPLSVDESMDYLAERLRMAGAARASDVLSRPAMRAIVRYARGTPRKLNIIANLALIAGMSRDERPVSEMSVSTGLRTLGHGGLLGARRVAMRLRDTLANLPFVPGTVAATIPMLVLSASVVFASWHITGHTDNSSQLRRTSWTVTELSPKNALSAGTKKKINSGDETALSRPILMSTPDRPMLTRSSADQSPIPTTRPADADRLASGNQAPTTSIGSAADSPHDNPSEPFSVAPALTSPSLPVLPQVPAPGSSHSDSSGALSFDAAQISTSAFAQPQVPAPTLEPPVTMMASPVLEAGPVLLNSRSPNAVPGLLKTFELFPSRAQRDEAKGEVVSPWAAPVTAASTGLDVDSAAPWLASITTLPAILEVGSALSPSQALKTIAPFLDRPNADPFGSYHALTREKSVQSPDASRSTLTTTSISIPTNNQPQPVEINGRDSQLSRPKPQLEATIAKPSATPSEVVASFLDALKLTMMNADSWSFEERYRLLEPVVRRTFDLLLIGKIIAGNDWGDLSDAQKAQLIKTLTHYVTSIYLRQFDGYTGERFELNGDFQSSSGTIVRTTLNRPSNPSIDFRYVLNEDTENVFRISDVFLNNTTSELAARRSEFGSVLKQSGFSSLIQILDQKADLHG